MSQDEKDTQSTCHIITKRHHGKKDTKQKEHQNVWELREVENFGHKWKTMNSANSIKATRALSRIQFLIVYAYKPHCL
jgi:hypothetical protein